MATASQQSVASPVLPRPACPGYRHRPTGQERAALGEVLAAGGHLPWDDFAARYDDDLDESPYWEWHQPQTLMGRLRARGLLIEHLQRPPENFLHLVGGEFDRVALHGAGDGGFLD